MKINCKITFRFFVQSIQKNGCILFRFTVSTIIFHKSWGILFFGMFFEIFFAKIQQFFQNGYFSDVIPGFFAYILYIIVYNGCTKKEIFAFAMQTLWEIPRFFKKARNDNGDTEKQKMCGMVKKRQACIILHLCVSFWTKWRISFNI